MLAAAGPRPRARLSEVMTATLRAQSDWRVLRQTLLTGRSTRDYRAAVALYLA